MFENRQKNSIMSNNNNNNNNKNNNDSTNTNPNNQGKKKILLSNLTNTNCLDVMEKVYRALQHHL